MDVRMDFDLRSNNGLMEVFGVGVQVIGVCLCVDRQFKAGRPVRY